MTLKKSLLTATVLTGNIFTSQGAVTWNASADFLANETPDMPTPGSTELSNPNAEVPEWSYGFRDAFASSSLTLFAIGDHNNAIAGNPAFQGWQTSFMTVATNTSGVALGGLGPGQLLVHPLPTSSATTFNVIRWTAPSTGIYDISASWYAVSTNVSPTEDGVDSHIVVNGTSFFDTLVTPGQTKTNSQSLSLNAGDFLDFVVGPGASGDSTNDSTIFNATITLVPEPSSALLAAAAIPMFFLRRRK